MVYIVHMTNQRLTKTEVLAERQHAADLEPLVGDAVTALRLAKTDTDIALAVADEVMGMFERGEVEYDEMDDLVTQMVAERIG